MNKGKFSDKNEETPNLRFLEWKNALSLNYYYYLVHSPSNRCLRRLHLSILLIGPPWWCCLVHSFLSSSPVSFCWRGVEWMLSRVRTFLFVMLSQSSVLIIGRFRRNQIQSRSILKWGRRIVGFPESLKELADEVADNLKIIIHFRSRLVFSAASFRLSNCQVIWFTNILRKSL